MLLAAAPIAGAGGKGIFSDDEQAAVKDKTNNGKHLGDERGARGVPRLGPPSWAHNDDNPSDHDNPSDDDSSDDDDSSGDDGASDDGAPVNTAPVAVVSAPTTADVGSTVTFDASGSTDADGDTLTMLWTLDQAPAASTATVGWAGTSVTLVPDVVGTYVVTLHASDGTETVTAQATVEAVIPNLPPVAVDDSYGVIEGTTLTAGGAGLFVLPTVLSNDSDPEGEPITASLETSPAGGTIVFNSDGSFTYTPNPGFVGTDTFTYRVSDGSGSAVGVVSIRVIDLP